MTQLPTAMMGAYECFLCLEECSFHVSIFSVNCSKYIKYKLVLSYSKVVAVCFGNIQLFKVHSSNYSRVYNSIVQICLKINMNGFVIENRKVSLRIAYLYSF